VVKIEGCSYEAFKLMIELIYDDPYDKHEKAFLCRDDFGLLFELLILAEKYQIEGTLLLLLLLKDNPSFNEIGVSAPNRRNNVSTGFTP